MTPPAEALPVLPTGVTEVDAALTIGGLPCGALTEFVGESGTGKSYLALRAIASAQQRGKTCLLLDTEGAHHPVLFRRHDINADALVMARPESLEAARAIIDEALYNRLCDLLIIDSFHGLALPKPHGPSPLSLHTFLPHLQTLVAATGAACLITNHLSLLDGQPAPYYGDLMRQYAAVRALLTLEAESTEGIDVRFEVKRNNLAPQLGEAVFPIAF